MECQADIYYSLHIRYNKMMKSEEEIREDWGLFANNAFIEWRGSTRATVTDFAAWVGISQSLMSRQLNGGAIPRDQKTIFAWAHRYGNKIYEILGLPIPSDSYESLPPKMQSAVREIRETLTKYNLSGDSEEAEKVTIDILIKHGYKVSKPEDSSS